MPDRNPISSRDTTDTRSELGARFDRILAVYTNAVLALRGRVAWAHDWVSDPTLTPVFQTLPGASFIVNGTALAKDSRADLGRRRASPRQRCFAPRQVRRRVRFALLHVRRDGYVPLSVVARRGEPARLHPRFPRHAFKTAAGRSSPSAFAVLRFARPPTSVSTSPTSGPR